MTKVNQSGVTIVEVLVSVAVVSSVLAIAYSIMNRNIYTMQDNQERTNASKIAQTQIERLRAGWDTHVGDGDAYPGVPDAFGFGPSHFCLPDAFPTSTNVVVINGFEEDIAVDLQSTDYLGCMDPTGLFKFSIYHNHSSNNYLIRVRWVGLNDTNNEVLMSYRFE